MPKTQLRLLTTLVAVFVLMPGYGHSNPDSVNWATVESPAEHEGVLFGDVPVIIQLEEGADLSSFRARLNRKEVTDRFDYDEDQHRLTATLGPEDGLTTEEKNGRNRLWTRIWGGEENDGSRDKDLRTFFVTDADRVNWATVECPAEYETVAFGDVPVIVQLEEGVDLTSFKAKLNGNKVTDRFQYDGVGHRLTATLGPEDGLISLRSNGRNRLRIRIRGDEAHKRKKDTDLRTFFALDDTYNALPAGQLDPTGCETYIGAHPTYPGELLCCSAPSSGSAPVCAPPDTPDIPCVTEFEFCEDGTASKALSPDPKSGYPGHTISTSGSWAVDPDTGELEIITTSSALGGAMITVTTETYPLAFTYDAGDKLDLYSVGAVTIDALGIGDYHRDASSITDITGLWAARLTAAMNTDVAVTATGYDSEFVQEIECEPADGMVCQVVPKSEEVLTSGTHTLPIDLYVTPAGRKLFQTDEAKVLVFERQPDPCAGIACGEHGSCDDGVCVCTHGYIGEFCDVAGLCAGVVCAGNATCVEGICECDPGYQGTGCDVDINECDPNPCLNGGSCAEGVPGTYECTCVGGYAGDDCEKCPTDADGDGYGDPASVLCTYPEPDCDDDHSTVYPGAPELCDGLDNQCAGDAGYGSIDEGYAVCADMISIPPGCFEMGDAFAEGWPDELPVHDVCTSAFEMDIHEVTNAEYAECVDVGPCTPPSQSSSYSRATYYGDPAYDDFPVIWMEWQQMDEYCSWAGKRLPTEAEWEYAARGGLPGMRYPWGDTITSADANYDFNTGDTTRVESYAPNGYGLYDMAGNVWEWVADWFDEDYYSVSPTNDPTGPATGAAHVRRGGSWDHSAFGLRVATRCDFCHADRHGNNLGGRCAR